MGRKKLFVWIIFVIFHSVLCDNTYEDCKTQSPCLCITDNNRKIDLTSLLADSDEFLEDTDHKSNLTYYFHGCNNNKIVYNKTVYEGSLIRLNFTNSSNLLYTVLGVSKDIQYALLTDQGSGYNIIYKKNNEVAASVRLICANYQTPFVKIINPTGNLLALSSPKACLLAEPDHGMSGISVFFLLIVIIASIYFIGGACVLYFMRGARGLEVVPNLDFWSTLPQRMKRGTIFILSGCRRSYVDVESEETYDRI